MILFDMIMDKVDLDLEPIPWIILVIVVLLSLSYGGLAFVGAI